MYGLLEMLENPARRKVRQLQEKEILRRRLSETRSWDPKISWYEELNIKADTYDMGKPLFKVRPTNAVSPNYCKQAEKKISPDGQWMYRERVLEAGGILQTFRGRNKGSVVFDGDILIPMIHQKRDDGRWYEDPWMSFTPMEFFTLRAGTKFAKGHVIVAGLGMGYQLEQVCKRKQVKRVTLIELEQGLVDWVMPQLDFGGKEVETVIGDANKLLPDMEADAALVDIYTSYGSNGRVLKWAYERNRWKIGKLWIWGSAEIR